MSQDNSKEITSYNFLLSNWYSGATVLSLMLNNHYDITCNGETFPFPDQSPESEICSCSKSIINCPFYNYSAKMFRENGAYDSRYFMRIPLLSDIKVLQRIFFSFLLTPALRDTICNLIPNYKYKINHFIKLHEQFFNSACEFSKSSIYLDGTKSIRRAELFAKYGSKPIKVIHSIRDGRKFTASYMKAYKLDDNNMAMAAKKWVDYIRMVELLMKRYPQIELLEIRHEDLCHKTESTIRDVCEFLGTNYTPEIFNFNDAEHHLLGNTIRKGFDGKIYENDKWKAAYTNETYEKVTDIQRNYLIKYGYL